MIVGMRQLELDPVALPANILRGEHYRITVLAAGLLRLEYSPSGRFEDRASQLAVNRAFPPAEFAVTESDQLLELETAELRLRYDKGEFSADGLSLRPKHPHDPYRSLWTYGQPAPHRRNFGGTARTLDGADGAIELEPGLMSRTGIAVVDDSASLLLTADGGFGQREPGAIDLYAFGYGDDYRATLRAFYQLTGPQPLLPRFALGNWWSRYHAYSAAEYLQLVDRFAEQRIPLSVAVLDTDWHLVDIDPRFGIGWTGYTWNNELFPDPPGFLAALHARGLRTALNVHPADGVQPHEAAYPAMARRLGIDPATERPVEFDLTDPEFVAAYFEELHHPLEDDGVDFWWLDWQQGDRSRLAGLDPLWALNHWHFLDSARRGRRPLTFSRYAGLGSHRYPIGFSGDTVISWESLAFQPRFTACASNVGYGWWSHDVGGHFRGTKDDELIARWVQLGVFSPINRLHSSASDFNSKEPWRFGAEARLVLTEFLRLRHQLVPYLYCMNVRAHYQGEPLVQPLYYADPEEEDAYRFPAEFWFGTELVVAPITDPRDPVTRLGAVAAWLPPGDWVDFFTGRTYRGGRRLKLHRPLDELPVLARAGAIVPLAHPDSLAAGVANPAVLELRVFAGAAGEFELVEDVDDDGAWTRTRFSFDPAAGTLRIGAGAMPDRRFEVVFCGFADLRTVRCGGAELPVRPGPVPGSVGVSVPAGCGALLELVGDLGLRANDVRAECFAVLDRAHLAYDLKDEIYARLDGCLADVVAGLETIELPVPLRSALVEILTAFPAESRRAAPAPGAGPR